MSQPVLALDFGGSKLSAAVVDPCTGAFLARLNCPTPAARGASASLEAILRLGEQALDQAAALASPPQAIGVSFGGPVSRDRRRVLRSMHVSDWDDFELPERLSQHFSLLAAMDNDANAAALGEWRFGVGRNYTHLLYVQVSTGIGAGLILDGRLYRGAGLAGEFGHIPLLPDGPHCSCGQRGCLESLASGWAIAREGRAALTAGESGLLRQLCGGDPHKLSAKTVFEAARAGDLQARRIVEMALNWLSLGLTQAALLLDPEIIVLGGGVSRSRDLIQPVLSRHLEQNLPLPFRNRLRLEFSILEGAETLLGAALLAMEA